MHKTLLTLEDEGINTDMLSDFYEVDCLREGSNSSSKQTSNKLKRSSTQAQQVNDIKRIKQLAMEKKEQGNKMKVNQSQQQPLKHSDSRAGDENKMQRFKS